MICRNCNHQYDDTAFRCPFCGALNEAGQGTFQQQQQPPQGSAPYAQPYYPPQYQGDTETKKGLGFAAVSLVCGILSILFCFLLLPLSLILGILGIVFGMISKAKAPEYRGLAIGGLVCGIIGLGIALFIIIIAMVMVTGALMYGISDLLEYGLY